MGKKIVAIIGIAILGLMYLVTLFLAIFGGKSTVYMFRMSIAATIIIPVFLYIYMWMIKILKNKKPIDNENDLVTFDNKAGINEISDNEKKCSEKVNED